MDFSQTQGVFEDLIKLDPQLAQALQSTRQLAPEAAKVLARHMFSDGLVPRLGNKLAHDEFLNSHKNDGVHVHLDMNDFGQINKYHGQEVGDEAIKKFGNILSDVSRMIGGKAYRTHGDEFALHFPTVDHAHSFARELRARLEAEPKIGPVPHPNVAQEVLGVNPNYKGHNLAASIGIGYSPDHAEGALLEAKKQLGPKDAFGHRQNIHTLGDAPTVIHSLMHEPPPQGWKPSKGVDARQVGEPQPLIQGPGKLNNPLK
jgi:GGDEF domain-containing protein